MLTFPSVCSALPSLSAFFLYSSLVLFLAAAAAPPAPAASAPAPAPSGGGGADAIVAAITAQGSVVRDLKVAGQDVAEAVAKLLALKEEYKTATGTAYKAPNEGSKKKKKKK